MLVAFAALSTCLNMLGSLTGSLLLLLLQSPHLPPHAFTLMLAVFAAMSTCWNLFIAVKRSLLLLLLRDHCPCPLTRPR